MKKLPIFLLTLLACGIFMRVFSEEAHALYIDSDEVTWYTVPELLEYKEQIDRELGETCGENTGCREEFYFNREENEPKFRALEQLTEQQLVVTSMNSGEEKIKVLFFDEDMMLRRMGIREEVNIGRVYIGWLEDNLERIYWDGMDYDKYKNEEINGAHKIYAWQSGDVVSNKIRNNVETEIPAVGLGENKYGQLIYLAESGLGNYNALGRFIYSECFSDPDYKEGTECKLVVSAEKGQKYMPPKETRVNSVLIQQDSEEPKDESGSNELSSEKTDETEKSETEAKDKTNKDAKETTEKETKEEIIKSPETGQGRSICNQKTIEFPWWLVFVIAIMDAVVLWAFWPKTGKTRRKPLTKKGKCDKMGTV